MAIHWQIPFVSLRSGTAYTVNVYDADYTGNPITLIGGVEPFSTEEDGDDDPFAPVRAQSGHLRIVDTGYAADGTTPFNWKDFVPATAAASPVTLTHVSGGSTVVDWQGFIQSQDYSGTLYGNPQERDFPVYCALSLLEAQEPSTTDLDKHNFAWLLNYAISTIETLSSNAVGFDTFIIQGNQDAQFWLLKQFSMMNFMEENDDPDAEITPQYNLFEIMEDTMKFWGWTLRSQGRNIFLTCHDDLTEPKFVRMTRANLQSMAGGALAGTNNVDFITATLSGDIFASTDNDDFKRRGPSKVVVQADCNEQDTLAEFAPPSVRETFESSGYGWVAGDEPGTGYYTTTQRGWFDSLLMSGTSTNYGGFCSRQIYSSAESDSPTKADIMAIWQGYTYGQPVIKIQIKKHYKFAGGSLKISGDVYDGAKKWPNSDENDFLLWHIGIGETYETAKWYYISVNNSGWIYHGWQTTQETVTSIVNSSGFKGVGKFFSGSLSGVSVEYPGIPLEAGLEGYIFIDILGMNYEYTLQAAHFEVANLKVEYSREETIIPSNINTTSKARVMAKDRVSTFEYKATNNNGTGEEWNADCIFASDNNMEYGYGLIVNTDGTYMDKVRYGHDLSGDDQDTEEHPEQHLADRVAAFWATSKRQVTTELRTDAIPAITPIHKVTLDSTTFYPTAISRDWRDDVTILTLLEARTS